MIFTLLSHQWRSFWRSRSAGKNLAAQIFIGFVVVYLLGCALLLGLSLPHFLPELFPGQNIIRAFCGLILYYFAIDILARFQLQELPILSVQPYLGQNIRRSQLVRFLNVRSLFHFLNLLPLFIFIPFIVTVIGKAYGPWVTTCFLISILSIIVFNHFLILYIKRRTIINSWWLAGFLGVVGIVIALDYAHVFSFRDLSGSIFIFLLRFPIVCLIFVGFGVVSCVNNSRFLRNNLYFEEIARRGRRRQSAEYTWLQQWGQTGELIALNLRLILRNKRAKSVLLSAFLLLFYGFLFYKPEVLKSGHSPMILFAPMFMTGIFIINYGQFVFAWHSSYFDGLMSLPIGIREFIRSQFLMFVVVSTISFVIVTFYGFISWKIIPLEFAAFLYNIGINSIVVIYFATRSYKAIDLSRSASFNYQGTGMNQWINALLVLVVPIFIYWILAMIFNMWVGVTVIGLLGLVSLFWRNVWINFLTGQFMSRKHTILAGFREKS